MILGDLIYVSSEKHFFHIHTYYSDKEKWQKGQVFSTEKFNRKESIKNLPKKIREEEFEKVRIELYKNMPSRYSCLFLSDSIELATYWANKIKNRTGNIQCLDIELLSGKYVYVDEQIYNIEHFTKEYMQEEANSYWCSDRMEEDFIFTVLFEGIFRVCQEISLPL